MDYRKNQIYRPHALSSIFWFIQFSNTDSYKYGYIRICPVVDPERSLKNWISLYQLWKVPSRFSYKGNNYKRRARKIDWIFCGLDALKWSNKIKFSFWLLCHIIIQVPKNPIPFYPTEDCNSIYKFTATSKNQNPHRKKYPELLWIFGWVGRTNRHNW